MKDTFEAGMKVRREVLGNKHVDSAEGKKDSFTEEFQELITRYAWGEIWTRPGLERKTRSCITLAMMIALNREDEFKLHIKAGLNNGLSKDEIKEVILQTAIYAGVPAANSAYHWAQEVFADEHL
ncbi:MAG: 4-carboxymuconolactone decarboxylase [Euryarchaeota archaeon]|jgi:4-carboxymuconolactone decarboxylase|nr:4-carboxymuconolactone decarboxylase [Euryarchaeota archaeon]MBT5428376.1 4-carboxymuconolactone decarboxylase [Rhodospirillaceae bacterium]|tara:strand:+ start:826 stop:1200 length:375 start_codon:yes stop_codon:yes gene_type:complete